MVKLLESVGNTPSEIALHLENKAIADRRNVLNTAINPSYQQVKGNHITKF